jgi:metal-dependent HD superfamily phosphatase/phosphodiesterase
VTDDPEIAASLEAKNVTAVTQMGEGEHSPTDIEIIPNRLLGLYVVETRCH